MVPTSQTFHPPVRSQETQPFSCPPTPVSGEAVYPLNTSTTDTLAVVVMAKVAVPGRVKTRLVSPSMNPVAAAAVQLAMTACVLERVGKTCSQHLAERYLAIDVAFPDDPANPTQVDLPFEKDWRRLRQGCGSLGERMLRVWNSVNRRPVIFLGTDSPDVPWEALASIWGALRTAEAAVGPVQDGGYWTLASRVFAPQLLQGIDWGTANVYDQTLEAARKVGLTVAPLAPWYDVDRPADLDALRRRLQDTDDPDLLRLGTRLDRICLGREEQGS